MVNPLYALRRQLYFFITRAVPVAVLSLSIGLIADSLSPTPAPVSELVVLLLIPIMMFQVLLRFLRAVINPPQESKGLFPQLSRAQARIAVAVFVYGVVLTTLAFLFLFAWPFYSLVGVSWSMTLVALIAAGHFVLGVVLIMAGVTLSELFHALDHRAHPISGTLVDAVARYKVV